MVGQNDHMAYVFVYFPFEARTHCYSDIVLEYCTVVNDGYVFFRWIGWLRRISSEPVIGKYLVTTYFKTNIFVEPMNLLTNTLAEYPPEYRGT